MILLISFTVFGAAFILWGIYALIRSSLDDWKERAVIEARREYLDRGRREGREEMKEQAIRRGLAYYSPQHGTFLWNEERPLPVVVNPPEKEKPAKPASKKKVQK